MKANLFTGYMTVLIVVCVFILFAVKTAELNNAFAVNEELWLLETTLFGDGTKPAAEPGRFPSRIENCRLMVKKLKQ